MEKYRQIENITELYILTISEAMQRDHGLPAVERAASLYAQEIAKLCGVKNEPFRKKKPDGTCTKKINKNRTYSLHQRSATMYMKNGRDKLVRIRTECNMPSVAAMTSKEQRHYFGANNRIINLCLLPRITKEQQKHCIKTALKMYTTSPATFEDIAKALGVCIIDVKDIILLDNKEYMRRALK